MSIGTSALAGRMTRITTTGAAAVALAAVSALGVATPASAALAAPQGFLRALRTSKLGRRGGPLALAATLAVALLAAMAVAAPVHAATQSDRFDVQMSSAHLTAAQRATLKAEVATYVTSTNGNQTAANVVAFAGGEVRIALPGEAYPRDFALPEVVNPDPDPCLTGPVGSGYFCAYQGSSYAGTEYAWYHCGTYSIPFHHGGSWINDQSSGTVARMYNSSGKDIFNTPPAYSSDANADWWPVWQVKNC
ncbi:hypothetical protein [Amycolatopsis sp. NPDC004625]|uniref:hypothetical protein n=1 Tax=Amycolatopsis sp. NPDC004625 TaxID=3154670 RepID=UPI0033BD445B